MKRIIWIDALKAFGAFIVFAAHFNGRFQLFDLPRWMKILNNGEFAVVLLSISFLVHKYIFNKSCKALENRIVNYLVK